MIGLVKEFIEFWSGVWANLPEIFSFLVRHYNDVVCVLILLSILIAEFVLFRKVYRKTEFQMEELKKIKKIGARLVVFKIIAFVAAAFFAIGPIEVIFESEAAIAFVSCLPPIILLPRLQKTILPYLYWRKAYKKEISYVNPPYHYHMDFSQQMVSLAS